MKAKDYYEQLEKVVDLILNNQEWMKRYEENPHLTYGPVGILNRTMKRMEVIENLIATEKDWNFNINHIELP